MPSRPKNPKKSKIRKPTTSPNSYRYSPPTKPLVPHPPLTQPLWLQLPPVTYPRREQCFIGMGPGDGDGWFDGRLHITYKGGWETNR